jgi:HTH-type transcriptional regulator, sugar sensing transcriptional regulator
MDMELFEDIGLSQREVKIYIKLLELGQSSAGRILKEAQIQNSVFHFCINRLIQKGLVSYVKRNSFKLYSAADPDSILVYLKDKEERIKEILPTLRSKQSSDKSASSVEMYEGAKGIMTGLNSMLEHTSRGDEFLFFSADNPGMDAEIQKFYERYDTRRREKGLVIKGIIPTRLKRFYSHRMHIHQKFTDMPVPANSAIYKDKMMFITWGEKPVGMLMRSKQIVDRQTEFFNALWKML